MLSSGKIIEYIDNGKFICGFVTELQQKRAHILNHNKREIKLPISRIIHCSKNALALSTSHDQLFKVLQDANNLRNILKNEINLPEIWDIVVDEGIENYEPSFLAELIFSKEADDDIVSALLRAILDNKIYFKYKEGLIRVHSREQVEKILHQAALEEEKSILISKGAAILRSIDESSEASDLSSAETRECLSLIQDYYLFGQEAKQVDTAKKMLAEAHLQRPHDPFHILVKAGVWKENENIPLLRSDLPVNFSLQAIQQAETLLQLTPDSLFNDPARKDLTHLKPLTIDGATTLDFDDAITLEEVEEGYLIGVHISDVAHYVKPGDPLFLEAMNRGTSIYFPRTQIPMLPRHISQGICSLMQGETRAVMSFMIVLSRDNTILRVRIHPSIIRVDRRLTYEEADAMIDDDQELAILNKIATALRNQRLETGALLLPFPDVNIYVDNSGKVCVSLGATDTPSRILISEMMILANQMAAKYVSDRMVPGLFRAQEPPKQRLVNGNDNDLFINTRQRKQLSRGELLTYAKRHSGLGVNYYTTVTSPIRRLLDLVMQHQLHNIVRRKEPRFTEDMCKDFTSIITRTLSNANAVKQQRHRYWLLVYLKDRTGHNLDALVIESGPKRVMLLLTDILFDLDLPSQSGKRPEPGSVVKVKVLKCDPLDNLIKFGWS